MAYRDFREFLAKLREVGEFVDVDRPVDPYLEVGKALKKSSAAGGPALNFTQNGTSFPLVGGVYNSRSKALIAFEATEATIFERLLEGLKRSIPPVMVSGVAPVHEVVETGDQIDLRRYPIPTYSPDDGGPFVTPGFVVSRDPETGVADIGHYRFQTIDPTSFSFLAQPFHRFGKHIGKARKLGMKKYPAALVLGTDPVLAYTCTIQVADTVDDFAVAGGLRGEPVELVRAKTIDVNVPATAEIVFEFEVDLETNVWEGPLGEYTGYYTPPSDKPLARVTAITHRHGASMQALLTGKPVSENHILKQLPFEASFVQAMRQRFPTVLRAAITPSGGVSFYVVIGMRQRYAGEARHVILDSLASNIRPKHVIVVDEDIDVQSSADVEWALSFRVQPARDVIIVDGLPAGPLDPSVDESLPLEQRTGSAMGIDATRPFATTFAKVADVPGWQNYDLPEIEPRR